MSELNYDDITVLRYVNQSVKANKLYSEVSHSDWNSFNNQITDQDFEEQEQLCQYAAFVEQHYGFDIK